MPLRLDLSISDPMRHSSGAIACSVIRTIIDRLHIDTFVKRTATAICLLVELREKEWAYVSLCLSHFRPI